MTTNHIDQLTEWWENAEKGAPNKGDAIIRRTERLLSNGYAYEVGTEDYTDARHLDNVRILARAPKPKPAWHDARAVIAHVNDLRGAHRRVFVRRGEVFGGIRWEDEISSWPSAELIDPVPLIEAKVTDEAMQRVFNALDPAVNKRLSMTKEDEEYVRYIVTAALGLETK